MKQLGDTINEINLTLSTVKIISQSRGCDCLLLQVQVACNPFTLIEGESSSTVVDLVFEDPTDNALV